MNTRSANPQQPRRAKRAPVPVTAHRLFPAIVALWFAALFGIGSLVIPPEKLSAVVSALGIPKLIHAATPPLGFTARALLVLMMAGIGVIVGLVVGSRIASRNRVQPARKTDPTRGRQEKPVRTYAYSPTEHQPQPEPEEEPRQRKRGPLRASEAFADIEPLSGPAEARHDLDTLERYVPAAPPLTVESLAAESLADAHFGEPHAAQAEPIVHAAEPVHPAFEEMHESLAQADLTEQFAPPAPFTTVFEPTGTAAFGSADFGQCTADHREAPAEHIEQPNDSMPAEPAPAVNARRALEAALHNLPVDPDVRRTLGQAPLESLGTVQLVERLALALAAKARPAPVTGFEPAPAPPAVEPEPSAPLAAAEEPLELETIAEEEPHLVSEPRFVAPIDPPAENQWAAALEQRPEHGFAKSLADPWPVLGGQPAAEPAPFNAPRPSILDPIADTLHDAGIEDEDGPSIAPPRFLSARPATAEVAAPQAPGQAQPSGVDQGQSGWLHDPAATAPFGAQFVSHRLGGGDDTEADAVFDEAAEAADEDRYPSLLDIQPMTREAIRIAAPPEASEAPQAEPIVMFPNAMQSIDAPFAPPPTSTLQSRRSLQFQAPVAGVPVTPPELPAEPVDAAEADRALRAALATLQRMSGGR